MLQILLAQLIVPPTQSGPIRLPQRGKTKDELVDDIDNLKTLIEIRETEKSNKNNKENNKNKYKTYAIQGLSIYNPGLIRSLLNKCKITQGEKTHEGAVFCLNLIQNKLKREGYITTKVILEENMGHIIFQAKEGKIDKVIVKGGEPNLNRNIKDKTKIIEGKILHLPTLQRNLRLLKTVAGVERVDAKLSIVKDKLESAQLEILITEGEEPWRGNISLSNSGNNGSGELSLSSNFLKKNAIVNGDLFFISGETDGTPEPQLGGINGSLSYTLPISDRIYFTASGGYNKKRLIELSSPANNIRNIQIQGSGQLEWIIKEDLTQRHSLFVNLTKSNSNLYSGVKKLPTDFIQDIVREPMSGYLRSGINSSIINNQTSWNGSLYLLNGIAAMTPKVQRKELQKISIDPGKAIAVGGLLTANWAISQDLTLKVISGGQLAFNNLTPIMEFALGSDIGLRGLPGQLTSGDSGWLTTVETPFKLWKHEKLSLQLVPFIGKGSVYRTVAKKDIKDNVGTAGIFIRWMEGRRWTIELGWVDSFETNDNPGAWSQWSLADGLYAQAIYRF
jgi:hemolysin activation/secretion protein